MKPSPDDNLPEVVPPRPFEADHDSSPQVVSHSEHADLAWQEAERDKYPALYDTTPKLIDATKQDDTAIPQPWSPSDATTATPATTTLPWVSLPAGSTATDGPPEPSGSDRRICGLRRRTFFIFLAIGVIVIGAIIGGAVGGTVSRSSTQSTSDPPSSQQSSPPSSSTTPAPSSTTSQSSSSTSSTAQPKPTPLTINNGTAPPGLAFQGFSEQFYLGGHTRVIQEEGFHDLNVSAKSYVWLQDDTGCCLTFCANKTTATGWWCNTRYRPDASGSFPRIHIWCGGNDGIKNETCS